MESLSVQNDLPAFSLAAVSLLLALGCGFFLFRYKESVARLLLRGCSDRMFWWALTCSSCLVALFFAALEPHVTPWGGLDRYFARAVNITVNGVFGYGTIPTALFPPGYSFLLVPLLLVFGETRWVFFLTNIIALLAFASVLRAGLRRLGAETRAANLLTLIVVLYPNRLLSVVLPFSDVPFTLLYGAAYLMLLIRLHKQSGMLSALLVGLLGGLAALVRSNGLVAFIPLLVGVVASARPGGKILIRDGLAAFAMFLLILAPWTIRNYVIFNRFVPISLNSGVNVAIGNNPSSPVTHNSYIDTVWSNEEKWKDVGGMGWNEAQKDSFFAALGIAYVKSHPADFVIRSFKKIALTFRADSYSFGELNTYTNVTTVAFSVARRTDLPRWIPSILAVIIGTGITLLLILNNALYYLIMGLSIVFFSVRPRSSPIMRWILFLLAAGIIAMVVVTFGLSRYKEPLGIVLVLYCAWEFLGLPTMRSTEPAVFSPERVE